MSLLLLLAVASAAPTLQIFGQCPGVVDLEIADATPSGTLALLSGTAPGASVIPGGPCAGETSALQSLMLRRLTSADAAGTTTLSVNLPAGACQAYVEVVDANTCTTTGAVAVADALPAVCSFEPDPLDSLGEPVDLAGMTNLHNRFRARAGVPLLQWNTTLAASAQAFADTCPLGHDNARSPDAGFSTVGENTSRGFRAPNPFTALNLTTSWVNERPDYVFGTVFRQNMVGTVGHFTQMVWHDTTDLGCGVAVCGSTGWTHLICRYGSGGNTIGERPYFASFGVCLDLDNDNVPQGEDADDRNGAVQ